MSNIINTKVEVDVSGIADKLYSLLTDPDVMTEVHREFADTIDPWVPYDTGELSQNLTIDASGVTYNADYAAKQYYGTEFHHKREHHPLASAKWDEVAMQTERDAFALKVRDILIRRLSSGQN